MKNSRNVIGDSDDWKEIIDSSTIGEHPLLLRSNGDLIQLDNHEELLQYNLQPNDCFIHGPHGEIVPFAALAKKQGVVDGTGHMLQVDAHEDNFRTAGKRTLHFGYEFSSGLTKAHIRNLLQTQENAQAIFESIIKDTRGDIKTFIAALEADFAGVIPYLRRAGGMRTKTYSPMDIGRYIDLSIDDIPGIYLREHMLQGKSLSDITSEFGESIQLITIDGDFTNVRKDEPLDVHKKDIPEQEARREMYAAMMQDVISGCAALMETDNGNQRVFGLSIDPEWVNYPEEFTTDWIEQFYMPNVIERTNKQSKAA